MATTRDPRNDPGTCAEPQTATLATGRTQLFVRTGLSHTLDHASFLVHGQVTKFRVVALPRVSLLEYGDMMPIPSPLEQAWRARSAVRAGWKPGEYRDSIHVPAIRIEGVRYP
jgi:hypothetical protein